MDPELIANYECEVGEGPMWHPDERCVYWSDIPQGRLFQYDPSTGSHKQVYAGEPVGGFTVQADGSLLLFMACGAVKIWRDGQLTTVIDEIPQERESRFNDVIADPAGRVFCGTMPSKDHLGRLYRLDVDGELTEVLDEVGCSNGMGFTPDRTQMYYTDTGKLEIYLFDYDVATGTLTNKRVFVRVPEGEGFPDGMTVDAEGCVWSARWDGYCLVRYTPDGVEDRRIRFPTKKVSSVIFGGAEYTDIFVTTAGGNDKAENGDLAGALFHLNLGIRGCPEFCSRVKL
ncbi:MAG: SMP-30/gluconolactonase/LRE family protein [Chloroflexi bacterium]|nr:SMP-30/gluconolactonase/LRE family protein [Chloroflexota bacterium]